MTTDTERSPVLNPLVLVGALIVVAAVVAGIIALASGGDDEVATTGSDDAPIEAFETGPVQVSGTFLPRFSNPDAAVGTPVPGVDGISFDGEALSVGGDGAPRLYGFFAHWCPHCQAELPRVSAWLAENDLPGTVDVVAISTAVSADADNYPPSEWFDREAWPDDVIVDSDEGSIAQAFGLSAYPYWVGADADGNVAFRFTGSLSDEQLATLLDALAES